jgi:hypothetical protein
MTRRSSNLYLFFILIATAALWSGVAGIRLNGDDYQYIASLAPIQHIGDVFHPFVTPDFNRSFFRPVANMTMSLDFLFFGWSGAAFHLTNLFFHLVATLLVFYFARDIFKLSERESLWTSLIFGIIASHEYNLVVDTARADVLAAIFVMATFLLQKRGSPLLAVVSFLLALLSKEIAIMALPLLCWEKFTGDSRSIRRSIALAVPYLIIAFAYYFYHAHFTQPILESDPLGSEGAHSILAFLQNGAYSFGYLFLPLDLESAITILTRYQNAALLFGCMILFALIWIVIRERDTTSLTIYVKPLVFALLTGVVVFLAFERWRLYLPSVGSIAIAVLVVSRTSSRAVRTLFLIVMIPVSGYHIYRELNAQAEWRTSTTLRDTLKENLTQILSDIPERPATLGIIATPTKLGSAAVMQLGQPALIARAEADRINEHNREVGTTNGVRVGSWTAVEVYALDAQKGFHGLEILKTAPNKFLVTVPKESRIMLYPAMLEGGAISHATTMAVGDSVVTPDYVDVIRSVESGMVKSIEVRVLDTNATLLSLNKKCEFERIGGPSF